MNVARTVMFDKPVTLQTMSLEYSFAITPVGLADTVIYVEPNFPENTKLLVEFWQKALLSVVLNLLQG